MYIVQTNQVYLFKYCPNKKRIDMKNQETEEKHSQTTIENIIRNVRLFTDY